MKNKRIIPAVIAGLFVCAAALYASDSKTTGTLTVSITPGKYWKTKRGPQFAVWIEETDGTYVATLYVTQRAAEKNWLFAPGAGRPESLPVWYHAAGSRPVSMTPEQDKPGTDAVTSATPVTSDAIAYSVRLYAGEVYVVKVEVNHSFDYNASWPEKAKKNSTRYSGVNGQPSVVYAATVNTRLRETETDDAAAPEHNGIRTELIPAGTGSVTGSDGALHNDLGLLTTALQIIAKAEACWSPAE